MTKTVIRVKPNGPFGVTGELDLISVKGEKLEGCINGCSLCRCGASNNKPFCDGSHHRVGFKDE